MNQNHLRDQRGVAMLLELILVAAVLGLVGVAVYQSNHRTAAVAPKVAVPSTAAGVAEAAATISEKNADTDTSLSASAESSANQVSDADVDASNLGGSTGANSF